MHADVAETVAKLEALHERYTDLNERSQRYIKYQGLLGLDPADFSAVASAGRELTWHRNKWLLLHEFQTASRQWLHGDVRNIDPEAMSTKVDEFSKNCYKLQKMRKDDHVSPRTSASLCPSAAPG